jgi:hypothetical protein
MSKASQAAEQKLRDSQSLKYGDYNVTKDWKLGTNPLAGQGGAYSVVFNPNNPNEKFYLGKGEDQELQQYLTLDGNKGVLGADQLGQYFGNDPTGRYDSTFKGDNIKTLTQLAEEKRLQNLTAQFQNGSMTREQIDAAANNTSMQSTMPKTVSQLAYDQAKANQTTPGSGITAADRMRNPSLNPLYGKSSSSSKASAQYPAPGQTKGDLFTNASNGATYNWRTGELVYDPKGTAVALGQGGSSSGLIPPPAGGVSSGVPNIGNSTYTPPGTTAGTANSVYYQSLNQQTQTLQQNLDREYQRQLQTIQENKQRAQEDLQAIRDQQSDIINEQGALAIEEKNKKLEQLEIEQKRFDENYNTVQGLASQLTNLMTQGNALIMEQKGVTGLGLIRNPRVTETINNITAAAGVIEAGISVYNGQMNQAQSQLQTATTTITSAYSDQIDYYKSLANFYESMATDENQKLTSLTSTEQDFLQSKITMLENDVARVKNTADAIQNAMIDPDTALAYASAGVTLNDTVEQIGAKLAKYGYSKELSDQSNEMASNGYTALVSGNAPAGSEVVKITDSQGKVKTYYKKASAKSSGASSSPLGILDIQRYQEAYPNAGIMPGDSEATANAKVQATSTPEAQATIIIQGAKDAGATYEEVIADLEGDQTAIDIAKKIYGITGKATVVKKDKYAPVGDFISAPTGNERSADEVTTGIGDFFRDIFR